MFGYAISSYILKKGDEMKIVVWILFLSLVTSPLSAGEINSDCTYNGIKLAGKVQVVEHFPDFKIQKTSSFPDLKVKIVNHFPNNCGEWQYVEHFPDFKVQFVDYFPDFKIQEVTSFPGL